MDIVSLCMLVTYNSVIWKGTLRVVQQALTGEAKPIKKVARELPTSSPSTPAVCIIATLPPLRCAHHMV
jgi:hypothetical protein